MRLLQQHLSNDLTCSVKQPISMLAAFKKGLGFWPLDIKVFWFKVLRFLAKNLVIAGSPRRALRCTSKRLARSAHARPQPARPARAPPMPAAARPWRRRILTPALTRLTAAATLQRLHQRRAAPARRLGLAAREAAPQQRATWWAQGPCPRVRQQAWPALQRAPAGRRLARMLRRRRARRLGPGGGRSGAVRAAVRSQPVRAAPTALPLALAYSVSRLSLCSIRCLIPNSIWGRMYCKHRTAHAPSQLN